MAGAATMNHDVMATCWRWWSHNTEGAWVTDTMECCISPDWQPLQFYERENVNFIETTVCLFSLVAKPNQNKYCHLIHKRETQGVVSLHQAKLCVKIPFLKLVLLTQAWGQVSPQGALMLQLYSCPWVGSVLLPGAKALSKTPAPLPGSRKLPSSVSLSVHILAPGPSYLVASWGPYEVVHRDNFPGISLATCYVIGLVGEVFSGGTGEALWHTSLKWCLKSSSSSGKSGIWQLQPQLPSFSQILNLILVLIYPLAYIQIYVIIMFLW